MEEWKEYRLGEICESVSESYRGKAEKVVLINTSDVLEGECLNHSKVPNKELKGQFKKTFKENDILYSEIRPVNRRYAYIDFFAKDYIASTKLMVLRHNEKVLPKYLYYILQSKDMIEELQMLAEARSGTFPQITFDVLSKECVMIPNINTQEKILAILTSLDNKIQLNRKINSNLEEQAKALFKSWFIDFEPFKGGKFVDSELGKIPEGWNMMSFESFISESQDKAMVGTYPAYSVTNNGITPRTEKFKKQLSKVTSKEKVLRKNDLVFGMSRQILNWGIMQDEIGSVSSAYHVYKIDKERTCPTYLRYFIKGYETYFRDLIGTAAREGQSLDKGALMNKKLLVPSKEILRSFIQHVTTIENTISLFKSQCRRLSTLRDTLLPRLMSGEIEVRS